MGATDSNALLSVSALRGKKIAAHKNIDSSLSPQLYRPSRNSVKKAKLATYVAHPGRVESFRIRAIKKELMHYRNSFDKMVRLKTEMQERRLAILESCNARLGNNYHQMHQMYLELLVKTQAYEAQIHLQTLEAELATLNKPLPAETGGDGVNPDYAKLRPLNQSE